MLWVQENKLKVVLSFLNSKKPQSTLHHENENRHASTIIFMFSLIPTDEPGFRTFPIKPVFGQAFFWKSRYAVEEND